MRFELEKYNGQTIKIQAFFHRFGYTNHNGMSVLLQKVRTNNLLLTSHTWISYTEDFKSLDLNTGDELEFEAFVKMYEKNSGLDYGITDIKNIQVISKSSKQLDLNSIKYLNFTVQKKQEVWKNIKGDKIEFIHDENLEIQKDITILEGDKIFIELFKIKSNGAFEFVWKVERQNRWNKCAYFNPIAYGQALVIYGCYQLFIPEDIYFTLKDFYFKIFYSKPNIEIPSKYELIHYQKPPKFKSRRIVLYKNEELLTDENIIKKREYIYNNINIIFSNLEPKDISNLLISLFDSDNRISFFYDENSKYYKNREFLNTKIVNIYKSCSIDEKILIVDYIENTIISNNIN